MIVGFNHNIMYRGVGFHVQTEDSGLKSPSLVTLLYHGGTIVSSQRTSYADILTADDLSQVVEELAKEQHKGMLRRLTKGEFDQKICALGIQIEGCKLVEKGHGIEEKSFSAVDDSFVSSPAVNAGDEIGHSGIPAVEEDVPVAIEPAFEPQTAADRNPPLDVSSALDDLIFSYLTAGDEEC